jgi:putative ABC transport system permease protein
MKFILRNMWRRKARTFLTVFGIVVGIFALTVLSGLSSRLTQQVNGARVWFSKQINVVPAGQSLISGDQGAFMGLSRGKEIEAVPGVKVAVGGISVNLASGGGGFGAPEMLIGYDLSESEKSQELLDLLNLAQGRNLQQGDTGMVVMGSTIAKKYNAKVGETVELKGVPFEVVGIFEPTLSAPDQFAFAPYGDVLAIWQSELASRGISFDMEIAQTFNVLPEPGVNMEDLAVSIEAQVSGVKAISPAEAERQISQISLIFNAILFGIAFIALLVGGLSIINTMIMSVSERTQEIGLKKAIGAETRSILSEYLMESALIGFFGGLIGMLLGLLTIFLLNRASESSNITVFAVTNLVVVGPVVFAVVLGTLAGIIPAYRASRLKPVDALKED